MAFPDAERVIYDKNPLVEVICQLRFPPVLRIDVDPPAAFQERVRADYPFYELKSAVQFPAGVPPEIAQLVGAGLPFAGQKWHEFASQDRAWDLKLSREFISLACRSYTRWEDFRQRLAGAFEALMTQYRPSFVTRIGLRYQDIIRRALAGSARRALEPAAPTVGDGRPRFGRCGGRRGEPAGRGRHQTAQ